MSVHSIRRPPTPGQLLVLGAIVLTMLMAGHARASQTQVDGAKHSQPAAADAWPTAARSTARSVALRWSANVPATARLGAEPPARCRRLDGRHAACPIAIAVLARDARGQRPWRCSATVLVSHTRGRLAGERTNTRCAPFPPPSAVPNPAAALGTAFALDANGDIACLPASDGRVTCVMRYAAPTAERCIGAASVPLRRPARSNALGAPVCWPLGLQHDAQAVGRAQLLDTSGAADHHGVEARAFGWLGVGAA
jgi:hypothetical protein